MRFLVKRFLQIRPEEDRLIWSKIRTEINNKYGKLLPMAKPQDLIHINDMNMVELLGKLWGFGSWNQLAQVVEVYGRVMAQGKMSTIKMKKWEPTKALSANEVKKKAKNWARWRLGLLLKWWSENHE